MEIFDDMGLKDPEVRKFKKKNLSYLGQGLTFELQNFVLEGHPKVQVPPT